MMTTPLSSANTVAPLPPTPLYDVLIIGAGMAGLTAATPLINAGLTVLLVDKGRGVGGRLATRRFANSCWFDHGAQYFTANTPTFANAVQQWESAGLVRPWFEQLVWFEGDTVTQEAPQYPSRKRYIPTGAGMNSLAKQLATGLNIQTSTRIVKLATQPTGWLATDEQGQAYHAKALIITCPVPQTLELLAQSHISLSHQQHAQLSSVMYEPCLALMLALQADSIPPAVMNTLAVGYKARDPEHPVAWVGANHTKTNANSLLPAFTIHVAPSVSQQQWDTPLETLLPLLLPALPKPLRSIITPETIESAQLHRWRYALLSQSLEVTPALRLTGLPTCILAGDAFGDYAKLETSYLSGLAASKQLLQHTPVTP
jgi:renalase